MPTTKYTQLCLTRHMPVWNKLSIGHATDLSNLKF